jgi:hypothetical protein
MKFDKKELKKQYQLYLKECIINEVDAMSYEQFHLGFIKYKKGIK